MIFENLNHTYIFAALAVFVSIMRYGTYLLSIYKKETKPHVLSWFNWGLVVAIGAVAQFKLDGGLSAWVLTFVSSVCFFISILAIKIGEKNITKSDVITFVLALLIIPLWQTTQNAFIAIISLIIIDSLSYYPTFRKSWSNPWGEPPHSYYWAGSRYFFALFTIDNPTFENVTYLFFLMSIDWLFATYLVIRRRALKCPQGV
jgi:hypothetical protein